MAIEGDFGPAGQTCCRSGFCRSRDKPAGLRIAIPHDSIFRRGTQSVPKKREVRANVRQSPSDVDDCHDGPDRRGQPRPAAGRIIPKPLPGIRATCFWPAKRLRLTCPPAAPGGPWTTTARWWRKATAAGASVLGRLPVGYYEVRQSGDAAKRLPVTIGVLAPLKAPTPETSPVACDVAMAWFYPEPKMPAAANLCALAGLNWVRDRLSWGRVGEAAGRVREQSRYDASAAAQVAAGLKVLQVNHSVAALDLATAKRFPPDLRDAYRFYREMARRWQGKVLAFEPWNEADAWNFGNHTGSEMATMQKASYLGLKAGNPKVIVCQNAFASDRRPTTLGTTSTPTGPGPTSTPSTTTTTSRSSITPRTTPPIAPSRPAGPCGSPSAACRCRGPATRSSRSRPRRTCGSRPSASPRPTPCRSTKARRPRSISSFGTTSKGKRSSGCCDEDLTPRPGYLALAAVGRLLADARPLGQLKTGDPALHAFAFRAKPDGNAARGARGLDRRAV